MCSQSCAGVTFSLLKQHNKRKVRDTFTVSLYSLSLSQSPHMVSLSHPPHMVSLYLSQSPTNGLSLFQSPTTHGLSLSPSHPLMVSRSLPVTHHTWSLSQSPTTHGLSQSPITHGLSLSQSPQKMYTLTDLLVLSILCRCHLLSAKTT